MLACEISTKHCTAEADGNVLSCLFGHNLKCWTNKKFDLMTLVD